MEKLIRTIHPEVRVIDRERGIVDYIASDETIDSYAEVVRADGWRFTNFRKNAPFVDSHQYGSIAHLLGKVIDFRVENRRLIERVQWAINTGHTLADLGWKLTESGYLKAVSVGFFPLGYVSPHDPEWKRQLKELGLDESAGVRRIYTKQEQIELSVCIIGANPNALLNAHKAGALSERDIEFIQQKSRSSGINIPFPTIQKSNESTSMKSDFLKIFAQKTGTAKSSFESLRKAQRGDSDSDLQRALRTALRAVQLEQRCAFGDPYERVLAAPERRAFLNALARQLMNGKLSEEHQAILKEMGTDATPGSTMIADDFASEIYNCLAIHGLWATLGAIPIFSGTGKFPITTAYPAGYFVTEHGEIDDDTAFAGESKTAETKTIAALVNCSVALLEDSEADLARHLLENFEQALNQRLDYACFVGDGTDDEENGETTGLFVDNTIPVVIAGAGNTKLQLCDEDDFLRVLEAVDPAALQRGCGWWLAASLLPALMRAKNPAGKPLLRIPPDADGFYLCGHPVNLVPTAPNENDASKKVILFGEPRAYAVGLRNFFEFEGSSHHKWSALQRSFRAVGRAKGKLRKSNGFAILQTSAA